MKINFFCLLIFLTFHPTLNAQEKPLNPSVLVGKWVLDLSPHKKDDAQFASMEIQQVTENSLEGYFYRPGVAIQEGRINDLTGKIYGALESEDGTGKYYTAFYYDNGELHGSTHSLDRDFLSVWKARKEEKQFVPSFKESKKTTHKIPKGQKFTFGYLEVLENRDNPQGKTIQLPVYIFKSRSENPKPDPIIYTVGGPGSSTMRSAKYMKAYQYLDDRDFILFEQRGTQYAKPHLACPEWSQAQYLSNLPSFAGDRDSLFNQAAKNCRERLLEAGNDLNSYTTNDVAADIEDLRKVLGIERYNLLTLSYSTKIGQVLIRDYPQAIRSVVMDSPLPLEMSYDEVSVSNLMDAVEKLLSDCEADNQCVVAYPNLKERFYQFLRDKTENPLLVKVENPISKKEEVFYLRGSDLITVFTSANTGQVPNVPFEINKILNNDMSTVKDYLANLFYKPGPGNGKGMRLSVWCAEEFPFVSQEKVKSEMHKYPEVRGLSPAVFKEEVCKIWGVKKVTDIENQPVKSDIPVLLISGEYDNETPPEAAKAMQKNLPNSFHLVFKAWKHGPTTNWSNPCAMTAANMFFNNPQSLPQPECLNAIKGAKFKIPE